MAEHGVTARRSVDIAIPVHLPPSPSTWPASAHKRDPHLSSAAMAERQPASSTGAVCATAKPTALTLLHWKYIDPTE